MEGESNPDVYITGLIAPIILSCGRCLSQIDVSTKKLGPSGHGIYTEIYTELQTQFS